VRCSVRISLPDRPGALGAVAASLGRRGADIRSLEVVDVEDGFAVDELVVDVGEGKSVDLRYVLEELHGVVVEDVRPLAERSGGSPLELAVALSGTPAERALDVLVEQLPDAARLTWAAVLRAGARRPAVVTASVGGPSFVSAQTPWLPLTEPRRLEPAPWMPPTWSNGEQRYAVAAVPLGGPDEALLVARQFGPRFRSAELREIALLARLTAGRRGDTSGVAAPAP